MLTTYIVCFAIAMLIHELGHLVAAIVCRVRVSELGFGWGPKLIGTKLGPVEYKLHLLPLGAYTKIDTGVDQKTSVSAGICPSGRHFCKYHRGLYCRRHHFWFHEPSVSSHQSSATLPAGWLEVRNGYDPRSPE
jgi:membrane-associated protease RseP (regulator of RpoE activity)